MAVESMTAYKPGAPAIARVVAHDLEGYYYVILSLAFLFHSPYILKALPPEHCTGDRFLRLWLENRTDMYPIWTEAEEKKRVFCSHEGFQTIEGRLGREWSCESIKGMLREMRELLFYSKTAVTHLGMINIIERALYTLSTDHLELCQPVPMTEQWLNVTGSPGPDTGNPLRPALRVNVMHHQVGHGKVATNLFARMPRPPDADVGSGSTTGVKKGTGQRTMDRVILVSPPMDVDIKPDMSYAA